MTCPICNKEFRTDECPHSINEVGEFQRKAAQRKELEQWIREIVREEIIAQARRSA